MPSLQLMYGLSGVDAKTCLQVDMDDWAFSDSAPLATVGAGPCLNVVVHYQTRGCLAHIWNSSLAQTELYHKACFSIREMILTLGVVTNVQVWLGAGWAFNIGSRFSTSDIAPLDFNTYLDHFLAEMGCQGHTIIDDRTPSSVTFWDPGNVVYVPHRGWVCLLSNKDTRDMRDVYNVQTGKKALRRGRCT